VITRVERVIDGTPACDRLGGGIHLARYTSVAHNNNPKKVA
jgi:hypothetical protein